MNNPYLLLMLKLSVNQKFLQSVFANIVKYNNLTGLSIVKIVNVVYQNLIIIVFGLEVVLENLI